MAYSKDEIEIKFSKKDTIYLSIIMVLVCVVALVAILVPRYYKVNPPTTPSLNNEATGQTPSGNDQNNSGKNNNSSKEDSNKSSADSSTDVSSNGDKSDTTDNSTDASDSDNSKDNANVDEDNGSGTKGDSSIGDDAQGADSSALGNDAKQDKTDNSTGNGSDNSTDDKNDLGENKQDNSVDNAGADGNSQSDEATDIITDPAYYTTKVMQILKNVGKPYSSSSKYLDADGNLNYSKLNPSDTQLKEMETKAKSLYELLDEYLKQEISITKNLIDNSDELISAIGAFTDIVNDIAEN